MPFPTSMQSAQTQVGDLIRRRLESAAQDAGEEEVGPFLLRRGYPHNCCFSTSALYALKETLSFSPRHIQKAGTWEGLFQIIQTIMETTGYERELKKLGLTLALEARSIPFAPYAYFTAAQ